MPRHDPKSASFKPCPSSPVLSIRMFSGLISLTSGDVAE